MNHPSTSETTRIALVSEFLERSGITRQEIEQFCDGGREIELLEPLSTLDDWIEENDMDVVELADEREEPDLELIREFSRKLRTLRELLGQHGFTHFIEDTFCFDTKDGR